MPVALLTPGVEGTARPVLCLQGCDRESVPLVFRGERAQRVDGEGKAARLCVCGGAWPLPRRCPWTEGKGLSSCVGIPVLGTGSEDQPGRTTPVCWVPVRWGPSAGWRLGPGLQWGEGACRL